MFRVLTTAIAAAALAASLTAAHAAEPKPLDPPQKVKIAYVPIMKFATARACWRPGGTCPPTRPAIPSCAKSRSAG